MIDDKGCKGGVGVGFSAGPALGLSWGQHRLSGPTLGPVFRLGPELGARRGSLCSKLGMPQEAVLSRGRQRCTTRYCCLWAMLDPGKRGGRLGGPTALKCFGEACPAPTLGSGVGRVCAAIRAGGCIRHGEDLMYTVSSRTTRRIFQVISVTVTHPG